ncbi:MAG: Holliday junction DNA helicase RuvB C-terminal domain-containing protein [Planctomycetota bacterium]
MEKNVAGTDVNQIEITSLSHIHGQPQVTDKLRIHISAYFNNKSSSKNSNSSFGPVILTGPSGVGKTMTAKLIHVELGNLHLIETNGVTMNNKSELYSIFLDADDHWTLFIDEVHGLSPQTQLILLTILSERTLRVPVGKSHYRTVPLADFTVILATTHEYMLSEPLRKRMRIECRFKDYSVEDLIEIVHQRVRALNWQYESNDVLHIIAERAKRNPRQALHRNLQMCWDVTKSHDRDVITLGDVDEGFYHLGIDELGLEQSDRTYLAILYESGQSTLGVLSSKLSLPVLTIQRLVEPYLLKEGFIIKNNSSIRIITEKGRKHIESTLFPLMIGG